ncbi:MAG: hypothetical protein GEU94_10980 [Micromonosporaceae bacterium]|nr:hypothetical protein [Micromonosporaceae bacterium]
MVQPGDPYSRPEFGGQQQPWGQPPPQPGQDPWGQPSPQPAQDPWGEPPHQPNWGQPAPPQPQPGQDQWGQQPGWGQPPQSPAYGSPDPWAAPGSVPPGSVPPGGGWPAQGGGGYPPPPPKSSTGLILGIVGGVVVLLLVLVIGGWYLLQDDEKPPVANPTGDVSASPSPSPSPSPSGKQSSDLDDEETDPTPLSTSQMFPETTFTSRGGETYSLAGTLEGDACKGVGASKIRDLLRRYDCDRMVAGVYLDSDEKVFSSLLVIPLATKDDADDVEEELLADEQEHINALTYYCPADGKPGADQCKRKADDPATWYASFHTFHRYLLVSITLFTDGHRTDKLDHVNQMSADIVTHVKAAMLED